MEVEHIALDKSQLAPHQLATMVDVDATRDMITQNIQLANEAPYTLDPSLSFTMTGALRVPTLMALGGRTQEFFTKVPGRYVEGPHGYTLHGDRYIVAGDTNITGKQKLDILYTDLEDSLIALDGAVEVVDVVALSDYVKNTAVTLFNTYSYNEKGGDVRLDDLEYQAKRDFLQRFTYQAVVNYYHPMIGGFSYNKILAEGMGYMRDIVDGLKAEFDSLERDDTCIVRPESPHPLTILASAYLATQKYPETQIVVGLPTGSTEFACVVTEAYRKRGQLVEILLLPSSVHSTKRGPSEADTLIDHNAYILNGKKVLVVDDNSSTGRSLRRIGRSIVAHSFPYTIDFAVASADVIRSAIDVNKPTRKHIANPVVYGVATEITPVSRHRKPKHGIPELKEARQRRRMYERLPRWTTPEQIKADAMLMELDPEDPNRIDTFRYTWLSNFHPITIRYEGLEYPSVEHAYQHAKIEGIIGKELFTSRHISAGTVKELSISLQKDGVIPKDWDERKVDVMVELLLQKFSNPELAQKLLDTGDKVLIEGNDWGDTFWGQVDGKGNNMLGRILMTIRDRLHESGVK